MNIRYPLAGTALDEVINVISFDQVFKVKDPTIKARTVSKVSNKEGLIDTEPYEYYVINSDKYRLIRYENGKLNGRPFFIPYYEYSNDCYKTDAVRFLFRTHKKLEKALKAIFGEDSYQYKKLLKVLGKPRNHKEFIDLLSTADLKKPATSQGANIWDEYIYSFLRVEQISYLMVESFADAIKKDVENGLSPAQARYGLKAVDLAERLRQEHDELSLSLLDMSQKLYFPTNGLVPKDLKNLFGELASEAWKAPVPKNREMLFLMNRAIKIAGILECLKLLEEKAEGQLPEIEPEIAKYYKSCRRLTTLRRREKEVRQEAKDKFLQAKDEFDEAFTRLPESFQKKALRDLVSYEGALNITLMARYPLTESVIAQGNFMQGFCNLR